MMQHGMLSLVAVFINGNLTALGAEIKGACGGGLAKKKAATLKGAAQFSLWRLGNYCAR